MITDEIKERMKEDAKQTSLNDNDIREINLLVNQYIE